MSVGGIGLGLGEALSDYVQGERQRKRAAEDQALDQQMALIRELASRPDANPALLGSALHDLAAFGQAKATRPLKSGAAGFLGAHEMPISQFLSGIEQATRPVMGPTAEPVPAPQTPMQQGLMPQAGMITPGPTDPLTGERVGPSIPPQPLSAPPDASQLVKAGAEVQQYNQGPKTRPVAPEQQPYFRSPQEMAQLEGQKIGVTGYAAAMSKLQPMFDLIDKEAGNTPPDQTAKLKMAYLNREMFGPAAISSEWVSDPNDPSRLVPTSKVNLALSAPGTFSKPAPGFGSMTAKIEAQAQGMLRGGQVSSIEEGRDKAYQLEAQGAQTRVKAALEGIKDKQLSEQLKSMTINGQLTAKDALNIASRALAASGSLYDQNAVQSLAEDMMTTAHALGGGRIGVPGTALPQPPAGGVTAQPNAIPQPPQAGKTPQASAAGPTGKSWKFPGMMGKQGLTEPEITTANNLGIVKNTAQEALKILNQKGPDGKPWYTQKSFLGQRWDQFLYSHGLPPGALEGQLQQDVGVADAYGLRGLFGGRANMRLIDIFQQHLAEGTDSPILMREKLQQLVSKIIPSVLSNLGTRRDIYGQLHGGATEAPATAPEPGKKSLADFAKTK